MMLRNLVSRRNLILISLCLLIPAAVTVVLAPKRALADEGRRIEGTFTVAFSGTPNTGGVSFCGGTPAGIAVESHGAGYSTLGGLSVSFQKTIVAPAMHGCVTFTAPNGDTLNAIDDGTEGPLNANNFRDATGTLTFTGGTGRFAGASGTADFTAVFSRIGVTTTPPPIQGTAFYSIDGTLLLPDAEQ